MTVLSHSQEASHDDNADEEQAPTAVRKPPTFSAVRVVVGTGLASGAALLSVFLGVTLMLATVIGAAVGGGAVALMAVHHAGKPPVR